MFVRIREVSTEVQNGFLYLLVDFWPSQVEYDTEQPPTVTNDFLMQLEQVVPEGSAAVVQTIRRNLLGYWRRSQQHEWTGDHTGDASKPFYVQGVRQSQRTVIIGRDLSDPHGLLAMPAVAALRNATFEVLTP